MTTGPVFCIGSEQEPKATPISGKPSIQLKFLRKLKCPPLSRRAQVVEKGQQGCKFQFLEQLSRRGWILPALVAITELYQ